ncbi:MAG: bifunctional diaminohydroxyphosphoribosylaminopyrimidine deaminase/5-amino-6-(5-phosphoribosylamino)uracil reductase RibD [Gammaproteobacteria bacterium]|nr:bifunctional diaminohydroxyphosphoribosylaminopyrimidine deaminase/5-amino-6-(5-phosphoribosylamino)uracil reductase RibD [Gammaproteobacteria bacterium]
MARAIRLAHAGLFSTRPNPRVGCVLVRHGECVGEGAHLRPGEPHAEVHALDAAGEAARGATAYVTLEPCAHQGRTPPCADALVAARVARVVAAGTDPDPRVAGRGLARLEAAGIATASGLLEAEAEALNPGFFKRMRDGRPWVTVKLAQSLDGRTALASGESRWITSADARRDVHRLRARSCAILTGVGTLLADDPELTVRLQPGELPGHFDAELHAPLRVVLDANLRTPPTARLLRPPGRALVMTAVDRRERAEALIAAGAEVVRLPGEPAGLDLVAVLEELARREVNEVLVEAGATLAGALLAEDLVDALHLYVAPTLLGDTARPLLKLPALSRMAERRELHVEEVRRVGSDLRITARPAPCNPSDEPGDS